MFCRITVVKNFAKFYKKIKVTESIVNTKEGFCRSCFSANFSEGLLYAISIIVFFSFFFLDSTNLKLIGKK